MEQLLKDLLEFAIEKKASDIHFTCTNQLNIEFRTAFGLEKIIQDIWTPSFFEYLKFKSKMDITKPFLPQSGQFTIELNREYHCRFSVIINPNIQTGVLRIMNAQLNLSFDELCHDQSAISLNLVFINEVDF